MNAAATQCVRTGGDMLMQVGTGGGLLKAAGSGSCHVTAADSGNFLPAANRKSDTAGTFRIEAQTGAPSPSGHQAEIPTPACLKLTTPF